MEGKRGANSARSQRTQFAPGTAPADSLTKQDDDEVSQQDRIAARRARIENNRMSNKGKTTTDKQSTFYSNSDLKNMSKEDLLDAKADERGSLQQVKASKKVIEEVRRGGEDQVTDVVVGVQARETKRRQEEQNRLTQWASKSDQERGTTSKLQQALETQWASMKSITNPRALDKVLHLQREAADKVIQVKNKLVHDYISSLKIKDDDYVKEFKRQSEEIDTLLNRMEQQYRLFRTTLADEFRKVEEAFVTERANLLGANKQDLESIMDRRKANEKGYTDAKINTFEAQHQDLENLRIHDAEEYNMLKIKLETDIQVLEQQLSQMRGTYQLNMEKLEYNYQVLKKREEENAIILAAQKRRMTKLTDNLNLLRQKVSKQGKSFDQESSSLTSDLKRMTEQYEELHKKYKHFQVADEMKFQEVKHMQESNIREVIRKLLQADKIIHEEQLSEKWKRPENPALLKLLGLDKAKKKVQKTIDEKNAMIEAVLPDVAADDEEATMLALQVKEDSGMMRMIFDLIAEEANFLIEDKLNELLQPLSADERSLIKIDAIFKALGIKNVNDIEALTHFFVAKDGQGNEMLIPQDQVVKALKQYTESTKAKPSENVDLKEANDNVLGSDINIDSDSESHYWEALGAVINAETFEKWILVYKAMQEYNRILIERSNLLQEVLHFKKQNEELEHLLSGYAGSNINRELCLPPPHII